MATKEQRNRWQNTWRRRHREQYNAYQRDYYRRTHPDTRADLARADFKALGGWTVAEMSVTKREMDPGTLSEDV